MKKKNVREKEMLRGHGKKQLRQQTLKHSNHRCSKRLEENEKMRDVGENEKKNEMTLRKKKLVWRASMEDDKQIRGRER